MLTCDVASKERHRAPTRRQRAEPAVGRDGCMGRPVFFRQDAQDGQAASLSQGAARPAAPARLSDWAAASRIAILPGQAPGPATFMMGRANDSAKRHASRCLCPPLRVLGGPLDSLAAAGSSVGLPLPFECLRAPAAPGRARAPLRRRWGF
ncbi:unnamed protein product [Amoebophrya sp. A120]|nr:unnamed protein product [Amoebophrya sp. A120]|eukprot:GSA120T00022465001.1